VLNFSCIILTYCVKLTNENSGLEKLRCFVKFKYKCEVRFRDVDGLGHVNNAVYHSFLEQARCHLFAQIDLFDPKDGITDLPLILARTEIDYCRPAFYPDVLVVETYISKIGNKSFTMEYEVVDQTSDKTVVKASAVLVWYDHESDQSQLIPANVKQRLQRYVHEKA
jgi:acyl-CoA thioester hydrolase